jgi:5'-nucleotidase
MRTSFLALFFPVVILGCGSEEEGELDGADDSFVADGKTDVAGIEDGSADACGVLQLASTASLDVLDDDVKLSSRAAANIVAHRGTTEIFDDLAELDAIKYVGPASFHRLLDYARGHGFTCTTVDVQVLSVSDWHGQLDPIAVPMVGNVGGAAALSTIFANERAANRRSVTLTAGDAFGATPPLASFFEERTAVLAMNLMKFTADGLGNHNFDRGLAHLQQMIDLAEHHFLAANLDGVDDELDGVEPYHIFPVGGVRVAVIGVTNPDAEGLTKPGSFGAIHVTDPIIAALEARDAAAAEGAEVFILIAHMGATGLSGGTTPTGPLLDLARGVSGFDLILGDHTNAQVNTVVNGTPVVENKSSGATYARVRLSFDFASRSVSSHQADLVTPLADAVTADAAVVDLLAPYRQMLAAAFDGRIAETSGVFERGMNVERLREMPIGDLVADSLRLRYATQLGFTNGGGLRAPLPSSYTPQDTSLRRPAAGFAAGPPWDLVIGDVYTVLPFGNTAVTRDVTGTQLWAMLEHSVEALPAANGWFGQISGFRFTFDSSKPAGSRVVSVTLDGGAAIAKDGTVYTLATSDFIAAGGDGYTMLADGQGVSREKMAEILQAHIQSLGTLTPATEGRIVDVAPTP